MRVSAKVQAQTRQSILDKAHRLFCLVGFETATIRDIAKAVGVAPGTLFNYFAGKEAIAASLVLSRPCAKVTVDRQHTFEECVFAHAAATLRHWKPCRNYLLFVLRSTQGGSDSTVLLIQDQIIEELQALSEATRGQRLSAVETHLYWSLFLGSIAFWVQDRSRKQEATLALLDESTRMFAMFVDRDSSVAALPTDRLPEGPQSE